MRHVATVLYEDRAADDRNFALHRLVVRCVHDTLLERAFALDFVELLRDGLRGIPRNSNTKVRTACLRDLRDLTVDGNHVVALYDSDRVHDLVPTSGRCKRELTLALREGCSPADQLRVVLLVRNTETLIAALRHGPVEELVRKDVFERALKKDRNARDIVLKAAAKEDLRAVRDALRRSVPSLDYLTAKLVELVVPSLAP